MVQMTGRMRAAAIDHFGGPEVIRPRELPVPEVGPDEVLIRVEAAGVGVWDPEEREGHLAGLFGATPRFPHVLGSDGAGTVEAVGKRVRKFKPGDRVYAYGFMNPKGGFYAQYAVVKEENAAHVPPNLSIEQAGAMPVDAITALCGLDTLGLKRGQTVMIIGASGGVGHLAVQLAKRLGARVLAVASGDDGVALAKKLGADEAVDGHKGDVEAAARAFAPEGIDAALVTAGGPEVDRALRAMRPGGIVAYPNGVEPEPQAEPGVRVEAYDGTPTPELLERLNQLIAAGPFEVHVARTFPLERAAEAHKALEGHFVGKLAIKPDGVAPADAAHQPA
jgi:NADPH2:quinone reductase